MGEVRLELYSKSRFHFAIPEEAVRLMSVGPIFSTRMSRNVASNDYHLVAIKY
jgi:hypothetical protein